jgi:hypothetical protein
MNDAWIAVSVYCFLLRSELGIAHQAAKRRLTSHAGPQDGSCGARQTEFEQIARIRVWPPTPGTRTPRGCAGARELCELGHVNMSTTTGHLLHRYIQETNNAVPQESFRSEEDESA